MIQRPTIALLLLTCLVLPSRANHGEIKATQPEKNRLSPALLATMQISAYAGSLYMLDRAWYRDYPRSSFHLHDDLPDWKQLDKLGHVTTVYHLGRISALSWRRTGMERRKASMIGAGSALAFMTGVEILDGFSAEWGFSLSDMAANLMGAALFGLQELGPGDQVVAVKYSFFPSQWAAHRPDLLGNSLAEQMLKDYNGMRFWLSFSPAAAIPEIKFLPPWLGIALGYGADGLLGGRENPFCHNGIMLPVTQRYRRWFLAPDIRPSLIETDIAWLAWILQLAEIIKWPTPALEYNRMDGLRFHLIFL